MPTLVGVAHFSQNGFFFSWEKKFRHFLDTLNLFFRNRRKNLQISSEIRSLEFSRARLATGTNIRSQILTLRIFCPKKALKFSAPQKTRAVQRPSEKQLKFSSPRPACFDQRFPSSREFRFGPFFACRPIISLTRLLSHCDVDR